MYLGGQFKRKEDLFKKLRKKAWNQKIHYDWWWYSSSRTQTDTGKVVQKPLNEGLAKLEELHIKYNGKTFSGASRNSMVMAHSTNDYANKLFVQVFFVWKWMGHK